MAEGYQSYMHHRLPEREGRIAQSMYEEAPDDFLRPKAANETALSWLYTCVTLRKSGNALPVERERWKVLDVVGYAVPFLIISTIATLTFKQIILKKK